MQGASAGPAPGRTGRLFGVLVTFQRPDDLQRYLDLLVTTAACLAGIVVVDNDPSAVGAAIVAAAAAFLTIEYVASPENLGPAGGLRLGLARVLERAGPDDWVALLDDDNPPAEPSWIAETHRFAEEQRAADPRVGLVGVGGGRFDRRNARIVRLTEAELTGPVDVDFVPGNALPVVSVAALREAGPPAEELFFGMEEVEFGLRLRRHGFRVVLDGERLLQRRRRTGRVGTGVPRATRKAHQWRRYYAVRNQIWLARRYGTRSAGLRTTTENLLGRPLADLRHHRPGHRHLAWLGLRGGFDAWTGRLGRRVDPNDPRYQLPNGDRAIVAGETAAGPGLFV
jgi:glycosyltransferase involved in cell wall biosynthesis